MPRKSKPKSHDWRASYDAKPVVLGPLPVILCREGARGSMFGSKLQATRDPMPVRHMDHTGDAVLASLDKPDMYRPTGPGWAWKTKAIRERKVSRRVRSAVARWLAKKI